MAGGPTPPTGNEKRLERIIERASKLSDPGSVDTTPDPDDELVISAAAEAGIPAHAVSEALALERLGDEPVSRVLDPIAGRAQVYLERRIAASPGDCLTALDAWLVTGHHLRRASGASGSPMWVRRRDPVASMQLRARRLTGDGGLGNARRVEALVQGYTSGTGEAMSMVRVVVDRSVKRTAQVAAGGLVAGGGATGTALTAAGFVLTPPAAVAFGVVTIGGVIVVGSGRREDRQLAEQLAELLDRVARGEAPSSITRGLVRRIRNRT